jgi:hypothetical protein
MLSEGQTFVDVVSKVSTIPSPSPSPSHSHSYSHSFGAINHSPHIILTHTCRPLLLITSVCDPSHSPIPGRSGVCISGCGIGYSG